MLIAPGSTSVSIDVQIVDDSGLAVTGLVAATFPAVSWSLGGNTAATSIALSDLALITTAYSSGGLKERSGGYYRLDIPNAAVATTGTVKLIGEASGKHLIAEPIVVGGSVQLTTTEKQARLRAQYNVKGTVWCVSPTGNDSNDGLSWDTPKLTLKTTVEAGAAGDLFISGFGTHAMGNAVLRMPDNTWLLGAGRTLTTITSSARQAQVGKGCVVSLGNNCRVSSMTINATHVLGAPIGFSFAGFGAQSPFTNGIIEDVDTYCDADGLYMDGSDASVTCYRCRFFGKYDSVAVFGTNLRVDLYDCEIETSGPSATGLTSPSHGIWAHSSDGTVEVNVYGGRIKATNGNTGQDTIGVLCGDSTNYATVRLYNVDIRTSTADSSDLSLKLGNASGTLLVTNCTYDASKTSGTMTAKSKAADGMLLVPSGTAASGSVIDYAAKGLKVSQANSRQ